MVRFVRQVLALFSASMQKANITHGFYYSFTNNFYMNVASHVAGHSKTVLKGQVNVSQAEFERIALAQVRDREISNENHALSRLCGLHGLVVKHT